MLIKLTDFAEQNRITDRTVQKHIKENEKILEGHVERRGKQGTWLDDFAVSFLKDKIQLPTKDEVLVPTPREAALLLQLAESNARWAAAEQRAAENAEAAGKVKLLEEQSSSFKDENVELQRKVFELEASCNQASAKMEEMKLSADQLQKTAEEAQEREQDALHRAEIAEEKAQKYDKIPGWVKKVFKVD